VPPAADLKAEIGLDALPRRLGTLSRLSGLHKTPLKLRDLTAQALTLNQLSSEFRFAPVKLLLTSAKLISSSLYLGLRCFSVAMTSSLALDALPLLLLQLQL